MEARQGLIPWAAYILIVSSTVSVVANALAVSIASGVLGALHALGVAGAEA